MKRIKEKRSLALLILLGILTLGIYVIWHQCVMIRDVNRILHGDMERTAGFGWFLLFSVLTLNIYSYVWYYKLGKRLSKGLADRRIPYGIGGGSLMLLVLFSRPCPILGLVAQYQIIHAVNHLLMSHNEGFKK